MSSQKETKPKLTRKFISLQQKIEILDQLNNGKKSTAIAKDLKLNESTIRTIKQNETKIRNAVMSRSLQTLSKSSRVKDSLIPKTEKCLMIWIEEGDINELINNAEDLDEEELVQLADVSIINGTEESSMEIIDEVDENLCIDQVDKIVEQGKQLEMLVTNCDSSLERSTEFKINLQYALAPYIKMQKKHKIQNEESLGSENLIITDEQQDMLLSKENNKNSKCETCEHSIKKRCRWNVISDSSDSE